MAHVFVCYSSLDKHYAERIADKLKLAGFEVWWDIDSLLPGDVWDPQLDVAIKQSFALVVVLTTNAVKSHWVTYEWAFASALGIRIIPLMVEEVDIKFVHRKLEGFQILKCIDFEGNCLDRLTNTLKQVKRPLDAVRDAPNDDMRQRATKELLEAAKLNENIVSTLIEGLSDHNHHVRAAAAEVLGGLRIQEAASALIESLQDDRAYVRSKVAQALGKIGDELAVQDLLRALYDIEPTVRLRVVEALGLIGHSDAVSGLVEALDDEEATVKLAVVGALGRIKDKQTLEPAVEPLVNLLSDTTSPYGPGTTTISESVAQTLVFVGTDEALKAARNWRRDNTKLASATSSHEREISEVPSARTTETISSYDALVIINAIYGARDSWVDVADVLRTYIKNNSLRVNVSNNTLGIDPIPYVPKSLRVTYTFGGEIHSKTVAEDETLELP